MVSKNSGASLVVLALGLWVTKGHSGILQHRALWLYLAPMWLFRSVYG